LQATNVIAERLAQSGGANKAEERVVFADSLRKPRGRGPCQDSPSDDLEAMAKSISNTARSRKTGKLVGGSKVLGTIRDGVHILKPKGRGTHRHRGRMDPGG